MKEILINSNNCNQRIDKLVRKYLNDAPLSFIYKTFRKKDIKVNGHWVDKDYILKENDIVRIYIKDETLNEFNNPKKVESIKFNDLDIIYEDKNILIVNKPKGLLVHGDSEEKRITLTNKVQSYLSSKGEFVSNGNDYVPSPVHRLDRNTSGLVVFSKNLQASQELLELFKTKEDIEKYYICLVNGITQNKGEINIPLKKDSEKGIVFATSLANGGKEAKTIYTKLGNNNKYSLLLVNLITGRTHQIRVHFKEIGHPLLGDSKYGDFKINKAFNSEFNYDNQFLHAYKIVFKDVKGTLSYLKNKTFIAPLNKKEKEILNKLNISYKL